MISLNWLKASLFCFPFIAVLSAQSTDQPWEGSIEYADSTAMFRTTTIRCLASSLYTLSRTYHLRTGYEDAPLESPADIIM
jgi:hypothetical protein